MTLNCKYNTVCTFSRQTTETDAVILYQNIVVKRYKFPVVRGISPGDVMYSTVTIVNNLVLLI